MNLGKNKSKRKRFLIHKSNVAIVFENKQGMQQKIREK